MSEPTPLLTTWKDLADQNLASVQRSLEIIDAKNAELTALRLRVEELTHERDQARWIPVSKRLPKVNVGRVLVDVHGTGFHVRTIAIWTGKAWVFDRLAMFGEVTHWMPLPEPPKPKLADLIDGREASE